MILWLPNRPPWWGGFSGNMVQGVASGVGCRDAGPRIRAPVRGLHDVPRIGSGDAWPQRFESYIVITPLIKP